MPTTADFSAYRRTLQASLAQGNATEHTHRPALQILLESGGNFTAVNEPKRIECGAPDFVVTVAGDNPLIVGYVEAKDTGVSLSDIERDAGRSRHRRRQYSTQPTGRVGRDILREQEGCRLVRLGSIGGCVR